MKDLNCITQVSATMLELLNVDYPKNEIARPMENILKSAEKRFKGNCDRIFMYNPDAIAYWIYDKYRDKFVEMEKRCNVKQKMLSVYPPVTPACFGSMYSGLYPHEHGIMKYEKYVLTVNTVFDYLVKAGKKVAIVSTKNDSISILFLERDMDYFIYKSVKECNEKAMELIEKDIYDVIILYNGNYDYFMHRNSPTGPLAVKALEKNIDTYCRLYDKISEEWQEHNSMLFFAPDHGCHRQLGILGNHGDNKDCDMNIEHFYSILPKVKE